MELNDFIKNFASQLKNSDASKLTANTRFREDIEEWDSLTVMSVIAMIDSEYGVLIKGADIRNCSTIIELFNIVKSKR